MFNLTYQQNHWKLLFQMIIQEKSEIGQLRLQGGLGDLAGPNKYCGAVSSPWVYVLCLVLGDSSEILITEESMGHKILVTWSEVT